ncbi:antigen-presenting glycoprotein CD1d isoform X1 [Equus asinus]|uniref:antigen-presenting glycoprotein CD1d isoform X1 n=1 Tax=Equus asinus TaxID=9793 RepID=UPI0038F6F35F
MEEIAGPSPALPARRGSTPSDMRCLLFLLLWGLPQIRRTSEVPQRNFPFRCLQISSFLNRSWARTDGLAWLGELQPYVWKNDSDTIRFLKPWSQGTFSDQQWEELQHLFRVYRSSVTRDIQEFAKMLHTAYPLEVQVFAGCEVHPGNTSESFLYVAFQGRDILSFQGTSWVPAPDTPQWVARVIEVLNDDQGTSEMVQSLLNDTCPQFVRGLLETGKSELDRQVKPEAWLSSGPAPGPGRLLLVCHVSGFYPKPVWVMWMRGEQEEPSTQQGDILPNADETWYLRVTLDVAAREAAGLTCRVRHSSLGGEDIILYWAEQSRASAGLIAGAVLVSLLIAGGLLTCWFKKRSSYQDIL